MKNKMRQEYLPENILQVSFIFMQISTHFLFASYIF